MVNFHSSATAHIASYLDLGLARSYKGDWILRVAKIYNYLTPISCTITDKIKNERLKFSHMVLKIALSQKSLLNLYHVLCSRTSCWRKIKPEAASSVHAQLTGTWQRCCQTLKPAFHVENTGVQTIILYLYRQCLLKVVSI